MSVTVITPAEAKRLTTVENVRSDLGLKSDDPPSAVIERFIDQASARAASFCRRRFGREAVRERIKLHGAATSPDGGLLLSCEPVGAITSLSLDGVVLLPGAYEAGERFVHFLSDGERRCWRGRLVVIEYEAGWLLPDEDRGSSTAPDLPADIEHAVIQLVGASLSAVGRDMMLKSENVDGVLSQSWYVQGAAAALPHPEAEAILSQYRRPVFV